MPLVAAATASGAETKQDHVRTWAFNLFGQGIACYQGVQTLIASFQPVEALPSLRALTIIAARFEQMADASDSGFGIVVRMVLDGIDEIGGDPELSQETRQFVLSTADDLNITVPDDLPDASLTTIYGSLTAEMRFAVSAAEATYAAVGLHVKRPDDEHVGFHTKVEPGHFTDMVATACVIAQLDVLRRAAELSAGPSTPRRSQS